MPAGRGEADAERVQYWVRIPSTYDGSKMSAGQCFYSANLTPLSRIIVLEYVKPIPEDFDRSKFAVCGECNGLFIADSYRAMHGKQMHPRRPLTEREIEAAAERVDKYIEQEAAPRFDRSLAALKGN